MFELILNVFLIYCLQNSNDDTKGSNNIKQIFKEKLLVNWLKNFAQSSKLLFFLCKDIKIEIIKIKSCSLFNLF